MLAASFQYEFAAGRQEVPWECHQQADDAPEAQNN